MMCTLCMSIKRAEPGSMQGVVEFKYEIELLSRVHHRNLVSLIGFCYEQGEQMLVYEYISNGTLRENLLGASTKLKLYLIAKKIYDKRNKFAILFVLQIKALTRSVMCSSATQ
jgi:serine/threonine protein kinase